MIAYFVAKSKKMVNPHDFTIIMVDSNLQRENILPSERAKAYKMKMDAIKRQGTRTDLTSPNISAKFRSDDEIGQEAGVSGDTIRNYISLPQLVPELQQMVDEKKIALTKEQLAADMNDISYRTETHTEAKIIESDDGNGNILEKAVQVTKTTLYIVVSHKDADDMASQHSFNADQNGHLEALLTADNEMWLAILHGIYGSDDMIVQIALTQIGNIGGEAYWSWYGFGGRVEWCARFVSWRADQCGYIDKYPVGYYEIPGYGIPAY